MQITAPEHPTTIDLILVERILSNLKSFTKVPKSETLSQYDWITSSSSFFTFTTKMLQFLSIKLWIKLAALTHFLCINDSRGGVCYKPSGKLRSPRLYGKFYYLIRTNFRGHLISRIWNTNNSRALIFAILQKMTNLGYLISRKLTKDRLRKPFFYWLIT